MASAWQIVYTTFIVIGTIFAFLCAYNIIDCCKKNNTSQIIEKHKGKTYKLTTMNPCIQQQTSQLKHYFQQHNQQPPHIAVSITNPV
jgi:hypothetical protein